MITIQLNGGLGNQLFQWAFGYALAKDNNTNVQYDKSLLEIDRSHITYRDYELLRFPNIECKTDFTIYPNTQIITEKEYYKYNPIKFYPNIYYIGYWQSYKYFEPYRKNILDQLLLSSIQINSDLLSILDNWLCVSMHIRRTDYIGSYYHTSLSLKYYDDAISSLQPYDYLLIFSDDINWCKDNLKYSNMIFIENNNNIIDFNIMSRCQINIIANSSFSWWAAWLNRNENKKVIYPKQWTSHHNTDDIDLIPQDWIGINTI